MGWGVRSPIYLYSTKNKTNFAMLNLILFGAPGAGKGTQAAQLVKRYGLLHCSTGEFLRRAIAEQTPQGLIAKSYIDRGELVPDAMVIELIDQVIEENRDSKGFIFDGFPRTVEQAEELAALLQRRGMQIDAMLMLDVPEEELIARLDKRAALEGRDDDKNTSVIRNRIAVYGKRTAPVADYYEAHGKLHRINGVGDVEELAGRLAAEINNL